MSKRMTIRERLADMLTESITAGMHGRSFHIEAKDLWSSRCRKNDDTCGAWDGLGTITYEDGVTITQALGSYDTMTRCVKNGIGWGYRATRGPSGIDVDAVETPSEARERRAAQAKSVAFMRGQRSPGADKDQP